MGYNNIRDDGVLSLISSMKPGRQLDLVVSGNAHVSDSVLGKLERALEKQWGAPDSPVRARGAAAQVRLPLHTGSRVAL